MTVLGAFLFIGCLEEFDKHILKNEFLNCQKVRKKVLESIIDRYIVLWNGYCGW